MRSENEVTNIFGLNSEELEKIITQIVSSIPEKYLNGKYGKKQEEIKNICAKEFIFFQMQEKYHDPHYQEDLSNFIYVFIRDIKNRIEPIKEQ